MKNKHFVRMISKIRSGFTLIELLIVIAIIGLLASIVLVAINDARNKAQIARAVANVQQFNKAAALYYSDTGTYPLAGQGVSSGMPGQWAALDNAMTGYLEPLDQRNTSPGIHYEYSGPYTTETSGVPLSNGLYPCKAVKNGYIIEAVIPVSSFSLNDGGIFDTFYESHGGEFIQGTMSGSVCM